MNYKDFITKEHLWRQYLDYRSKHSKISKNRAMRAFCVQYGYMMNRRQHDLILQNMIEIAKVNLYEVY